MDCPQADWITDAAFLKSFNRRVFQKRVPLTGSFELTHRCNLNCIHCYLHPGTTGPPGNELGTEQIFNIIDDLTEAGCLSLLLTGGEPMLRKDFKDIYAHARKNGLIVPVFATGTLITEEILDLFADLPPWSVEISLYGATPETYEEITGVKGSFKKCIEGIHKLKEKNIRVKLKTLLMKPNRHEFEQIARLAENLGCAFRFDGEIFPRINGDRSPLSLRLSPETLVETEFQVDKRREEWIKYYLKRKDLPIRDDLYVCGAGRNNFHIDPFGNLSPCIMAKHMTYHIPSGDFNTGWSSIISQITSQEIFRDFKCGSCNLRVICTTCPPFNRLENNREDHPSEFLCKITRLRFEKISETCYKKNENGKRKTKSQAIV